MGIEGEFYSKCIKRIFNNIILAIFPNLRKKYPLKYKNNCRISYDSQNTKYTEQRIVRTTKERYQVIHEDKPIRMRTPTKILKERRAFQVLKYQDHSSRLLYTTKYLP